MLSTVIKTQQVLQHWSRWVPPTGLLVMGEKQHGTGARARAWSPEAQVQILPLPHTESSVALGKATQGEFWLSHL